MAAHDRIIESVAKSLPSEAELQTEIGQKLRELAALRKLKRLAHDIAGASQSSSRHAEGADHAA